MYLLFFFLSLFHCILLCGLVGACVNPESIFSNSLFVDSLTCLITHSFLNGFQPNLYEHFFIVPFLDQYYYKDDHKANHTYLCQYAINFCMSFKEWKTRAMDINELQIINTMKYYLFNKRVNGC